MRKLSELLELMLNNQHLFKDGLCNWVISLQVEGLIINQEREEISNYIINNRPNWYTSFRTIVETPYYWTSRNIKPRIKWLKNHIAKLKKEGK